MIELLIYVIEKMASDHLQLWRYAALSLGMLLVGLVIIGSNPVIAASTPFCGRMSTCESCIAASSMNHSCDWIPAHVSCAPREGEDDFLSGKQRIQSDCTNHTIPKQFPPLDFKHECYNGGIYSLDSKRPFGAYCDCPHGFMGSKCQVCNKDTICPGPNSVCKQNVRGNSPGEHRSLSCDCDSQLCSQIGFGPGSGVVNVRINFGKAVDDTWAQIDILKGVEIPKIEEEGNGSSTLKSPFVIRANLTHCTTGQDMPCSQVCGTGRCPEGVPWTEDETCRVWDCESDPNSSLEDYTRCPPGDAPWSQYQHDCELVKAMMRPPFQFVCIVPKNPGSPLVGGRIKCGFATQLLSHGSISLDCSVGSCAEDSRTITSAPTIPGNDSGGSNSNLFVCSGRFGDQQCWNTYYFLILMVPSVYTLSLVFTVINKEREVKAAVHASRILRASTRYERDEEGRQVPGGTTMEDPGTVIAETDQFIQQQQQTVSSDGGGDETTSAVRLLHGGGAHRRPSPVLSFYNVSFAIYDENLGTAPRRGFSVRSRRRGGVRTVLNPCSGHVKSGEICAILGPSGSGKTSLIDILAGRKNVGTIGGAVYLDGRQASSTILREKVGYVTQDDVLPSTSTVRECLLFHAALRGNCTMPLLSRCNRVEDVLEELNLLNCADSIVGGADRKSISGGERRRVSIACELLGENSSLMVMDEPTSGLDSNSTQQVIGALQAVVEKEKRTIVLSIHQPSTALFRKFDRVILLSATGRLLFCGPIDSLEVFFPPFPVGCNPAEHLLDLCAGSDADEMHRQTSERFEQSSVRQDQISELRAIVDEANATREDLRLALRPSHHAPGFRRQFVELSARSLRNAWRHPVLAT